jgi:hypothetical protein
MPVAFYVSITNRDYSSARNLAASIVRFLKNEVVALSDIPGDVSPGAFINNDDALVGGFK